MKTKVTEKVIKKGKPTFKEKNDVGTVANAGKGAGALETGLFADSALTSGMKATADASKVSGTVDKGVVKVAPNSIWPA